MLKRRLVLVSLVSAWTFIVINRNVCSAELDRVLLDKRREDRRV